MRSCHPPSTFHQWTFIFLWLVTSLPHHPVYKRLPFCVTPLSTSLLARWDAACFMNHLIRPTRSSNLVSWILVFFNTGKIIEPNKVIMFKKNHFPHQLSTSSAQYYQENQNTACARSLLELLEENVKIIHLTRYESKRKLLQIIKNSLWVQMNENWVTTILMLQMRTSAS